VTRDLVCQSSPPGFWLKYSGYRQRRTFLAEMRERQQCAASRRRSNEKLSKSVLFIRLLRSEDNMTPRIKRSLVVKGGLHSLFGNCRDDAISMADRARDAERVDRSCHPSQELAGVPNPDHSLLRMLGHEP